MEDGTIILVGATTENPSFELNAAVLSRASVLTFERLSDTDLAELLLRAEKEEGRVLPIDADARIALMGMADGDGRSLLNLAEDVFATTTEQGDELIDREQLTKLVQRRAPIYDKSREGHYNLVSALHKSVRGSDPDAALYWLARMLTGGESPLFLARRLVRMAVEDIGLADPQALQQALAAKDAYDFLGSPEGELALAQATIYLATAPKSNANYVAYKAAMRAAKDTGSVAPPKIILNAPTDMMADQGYGEGYVYDHDAPDAFSGQNYFPDDMPRPSFYDPPDRGFERDIRKRLRYWSGLRTERSG
jgi:putative ATPase